MTTQGLAMLDMLVDSAPGGCDAAKRIPRPAFPFYSTSLVATIPEGASTPTDKNALSFEAEVDTLFTDLSIEIYTATGERIPGHFSVTYCNTELAAGSDTEDYRTCCQRKPIFLQSVQENKRLRFEVSSDEPAPPEGGDYTVVVSLSGIQGEGCCQ